jgi:hypothetical protein
LAPHVFAEGAASCLRPNMMCAETAPRAIWDRRMGILRLPQALLTLAQDGDHRRNTLPIPSCICECARHCPQPSDNRFERCGRRFAASEERPPCGPALPRRPRTGSCTRRSPSFPPAAQQLRGIEEAAIAPTRHLYRHWRLDEFGFEHRDWHGSWTCTDQPEASIDGKAFKFLLGTLPSSRPRQRHQV